MCLSVCSLCVPSEDTVCSPALTHSVWGDLRLNQQCVWPSLYKNYTQHGSACLVCSPLVMPSCSWSTAVIYTPKHTHTHMPVCTQSGGTGWVMQRAVEFHRCLTYAVLWAPRLEGLSSALPPHQWQWVQDAHRLITALGRQLRAKKHN